MLKLLLIGFTQTNANVIQIFIEMTFKDVVVNRIVRDLMDKTLSLPTLEAKDYENDIFIIDFDGVGLALQDSHIAPKVATYLQNKPTLFVSRKDTIVPVALINYEWLTTPYTRQQMTQSVKNVIEQVQKNKEQLSNQTSQAISQIPAHITVNQDNKYQHLLDNKKELLYPQANNHEIDAVFNVLAQVFPEIIEQSFFTFIKSLQMTKDFSMISVNGHQLYLNPVDKSVVTAMLERISDNFVVGVRDEKIQVEVLDRHTFQKRVATHLYSGAKQFTLTYILWYIGLEVMQSKRDAYSESHQLKFEARYMPNFAGVKFIPKYMVPLIASCLGRPRTLLDFSTLFPYLTNAQVNQVMILLSLCHAIRVDTLLGSVTPIAEKPEPVLPTNVGVQKANKTGFLKRLLSRLGMS